MVSSNLDVITLAAGRGSRRAYSAINASCHWQKARIRIQGHTAGPLSARLNTEPVSIPLQAIKSGSRFDFDFPPESTLVLFTRLDRTEEGRT